MTNEFAIKVLTELRGYGDKFANIGFDRKEALDMAIKALEQEPCEDAISRQALLDKLERPMNWTDSEAELQEQRDYYGFIDLVQSMPSVTPQPKIAHWLAKSFHEVYCDNCGFDFDIMKNEFVDKMNYCPNCGKDMRGNKDGNINNKK